MWATELLGFSNRSSELSRGGSQTWRYHFRLPLNAAISFAFLSTLGHVVFWLDRKHTRQDVGMYIAVGQYDAFDIGRMYI